MSTSHKVIEQLISENYLILGYGAYSVVFKDKYDNKTVKVGSTLSDPWLLYAQRVKGSCNPHFPRIYNIKVFEGQDYYVANTEILSSIDDEYDAYSSFVANIRNNSGFTSHLRYATYVLNELLKKFEYTKLDLHRGNIMLRDKTLVLNDPIAEKEVSSGFEEWIENTRWPRESVYTSV